MTPEQTMLFKRLIEYARNEGRWFFGRHVGRMDWGLKQQHDHQCRTEPRADHHAQRERGTRAHAPPSNGSPAICRSRAFRCAVHARTALLIVNATSSGTPQTARKIWRSTSIVILAVPVLILAAVGLWLLIGLLNGGAVWK
jgi:hypothetical protein